MRLIDPPVLARPVISSCGGCCPVEAIGWTSDRRGFFFRAAGNRWDLAIGLRQSPHDRPDRNYDGDGYDVMMNRQTFYHGWVIGDVWPDPRDRVWRNWARGHTQPASFMPVEIAKQIIRDVLWSFDRRRIPRRPLPVPRVAYTHWTKEE